MQLVLLFALALCVPALEAFSAAPRYPVARVVELLKDMSNQLKAEQEADEEVYEKLACWCETNDKAKSKAIIDAEARISDLSAKIESLTAQSGRLGTEISGLEKEVAANQKALDIATALREKQLKEFNAEEKDMLLAIQSLGQAITVLSKHHGGAASAAIATAISVVRTQMGRHGARLEGTITPAQRRAIASFAQDPASNYDKKPTFKQAYTPQSGQIFGILGQMKETFETNLSEAQKEELANQEAYKELKAAKETEIAAGKASLEEKQQQLAAVDEKNAQASEDLEDTQNSLSADQKFLIMLKEHCSMTDKEWDARQKTRQAEIAAVSQAISILSSDESRDTFSRTYNAAAASFVQREQHVARRTAAAVLAAAAASAGNPKLALLAENLSRDPFTRVLKAIDDMVAELLQEKADEIKHKDFCVNGLNQNQLETERNARDKLALESKIDALKMTIKGLTTAIDTLKAEVADLQVQLTRAGEDRELEHKEFQGTVQDQRESQEILARALEVLKGIYMPSSETPSSLVQRRQQPAPPPGFDEYKQQGATSVLMLIEQIIADTKELEAETVHDEEQAQKAYEAFVKATNASVEEKQRSIVNKEEDRSKASQDLTVAESDLDGVTSALEGLAGDAAALHTSCDFVLKNFEVRQAARDEEVLALRQAKGILSGATFQ